MRVYTHITYSDAQTREDDLTREGSNVEFLHIGIQCDMRIKNKYECMRYVKL